jgi:hypothetical protein
MGRLRRCALALGSLLVVGIAAAAESPVGACGPIERRHDHVELRGIDLGGLGRTPIAKLGVLAIRHGHAVPIPFQLDESRGSKPALQGPGARVDQRPGQLDFDDVLLVLPCDAGDRATQAERARWASAFGATQWREIRIEDPLDGAVAWAYAVVAPDPPRTATRYVRYAKTDLVSTDVYRIGMAGALPVFFAMVVDGRPTPNLLDGLRLRATGVVRTGLTSVTITEHDASHTLTASGAGPIRVVRRSEHRLHVGLGLELAVGTAHTYFYPMRITGPGKMSLPFSPGLLFREITASGGVDLTGLDGWTFEAAGTTSPVTVDGRMSDAERSFPRRGRWFLLRNGPSAILTVMRTSPNLARTAPLDVLYVDDAHAAPDGDRVPGHVPLVGFSMAGLEHLAAERYDFTFEVLFEPAWTPGRETTLLREVDTPLAVTVTARSDRAAARAGRP